MPVKSWDAGTSKWVINKADAKVRLDNELGITLSKVLRERQLKSYTKPKDYIIERNAQLEKAEAAAEKEYLEVLEKYINLGLPDSACKNAAKEAAMSKLASEKSQISVMFPDILVDEATSAVVERTNRGFGNDIPGLRRKGTKKMKLLD
jgi:hypothetical protein